MDYAEFQKHYYLVIVDCYSRLPMVVRTRGMTTAHVLPIFQDWIRSYGRPTHVRTDGGPCFKHQDFAKWCRDKNIIHEMSSPHNHESNGQAERAIREVKKLLWKSDGHMETFQDALTEYKNCPGYDGLAPTQWAFGRLQRTNIPCPSKAYDRVTDSQLMEHLGRRGRVQETKEHKRPRSSPKAIVLSPGENVRIQDHKTLHWTKRAKVVKRKGPRTYVLRSGARTFIRNVRFIKRDPIAEDMEQIDFAQEEKDENENHSEVRSSSPANGPVTRSRSFRRSMPRTSSR